MKKNPGSIGTDAAKKIGGDKVEKIYRVVFDCNDIERIFKFVFPFGSFKWWL